MRRPSRTAGSCVVAALLALSVVPELAVRANDQMTTTHVCQSSEWSCSTHAQCSEPWPTSHPNHWRFCDFDELPAGKCKPIECGLVDGSMKRCPQTATSSQVCRDYKCIELSAVGEECDGQSELDVCFGDFLSCFKNTTSSDTPLILAKDPRVTASPRCEKLTEWRGAPCSDGSQCPSPLRCVYQAAKGGRFCTDRLFAKPGDVCVPNYTQCLANLGGVCEQDGLQPEPLLLRVAFEDVLDRGTCRAFRTVAPQCGDSQHQCTKNLHCDSGFCYQGECHNVHQLLNEPCVVSSQCVSKHCDASGVCAVNRVTNAPTTTPGNIMVEGGGGAGKVVFEPVPTPAPTPSQILLGDCSAVSCQAGHSCTYTPQGVRDFECVPDCGEGRGDLTVDPETNTYYCKRLDVISSGSECQYNRHDTCVSGHCYRFNSSMSVCVGWGPGHAPLGTPCVTASGNVDNFACESKICNAAFHRCADAAQVLSAGDTCQVDLQAPCTLGHFCGSNEKPEDTTCLPMSENNQCVLKSHNNYQISCGNPDGNRVPGACLCESEDTFKCRDTRVGASDQKLGGVPFVYDEVVVDRSFSVSVWDAFGEGGCPASYSPARRETLTRRGNKCAEQAYVRLVGSSKIGADQHPLRRVTPYWLRRIVADMDDECRTGLAEAVCCIACGLATDAADLPEFTKLNVASQRVWLSEYVKYWATTYVSIDCTAKTISPVWDACTATEERLGDMTVRDWATEVAQCGVGAVGTEPDSTATSGVRALSVVALIASLSLGSLFSL